MPETALRPQNRAEGLSGGAGKRCYGKSVRLGGYKEILSAVIMDAKIRLVLILFFIRSLVKPSHSRY